MLVYKHVKHGIIFPRENSMGQDCAAQGRNSIEIRMLVEKKR